MNYFKPAIAAAAITTALASAPFAHAGPAVGLDPTGNRAYGNYADLWTNHTDTALATGFKSPPPTPPPPASPSCPT